MEPHGRTGVLICICIKAESLADALPVGWQGSATPEQPENDERQQAIKKNGVKKLHVDQRRAELVRGSALRDGRLLGSNRQLKHSSDIAVKVDSDFIFTDMADCTGRQANLALLH